MAVVLGSAVNTATTLASFGSRPSSLAASIPFVRDERNSAAIGAVKKGIGQRSPMRRRQTENTIDMASQAKGRGTHPQAATPRTANRLKASSGLSGGAAQRAVPAWTEAQWLAALPPVLEALELPLDETQQQKLAAYMVLLAHWNATFNLTALRDPRDMLSHHLADCLAVLAPLGQHLATLSGAVDPVRLLDVGSGGGLPGVVLAIARPDVQVTCVDTVGKKAAFIRQVAAELKLANLRAEHARVEQLKGAYDVITSRAFASVVDFVTLTEGLLGKDAVWMAMKGKRPDDELAELPASVDVFHVEQLDVPGLDAQRCIVWMRQKPTATGR